ncbi:MAG: hypothetical protein Q7J54_07125 [Candidatus Woesearchaeota archaeon]|nr:hypothetical protein [Candidatus Woesearchaeota archaeon]
MDYDYMIDDLILERCNDIIIAIGIKSSGDLIPVKSIRDFDTEEDLIITKSALITGFQDMIEKIGKNMGKHYECRFYEDRTYLGCKLKNTEDISINGFDKFFYDLKIASKSEGGSFADVLDSAPISLDYNINRLSIGAPSLDRSGIQKRVELFFEHLDVKLIYFDNFSKEDRDIIEKIHCRLLGIIESVDCLAKLCFYPRYDLNISLSKDVSPDAEKKILEDIAKLDFKMYLRAQSKAGTTVWGEDRHTLKSVRVAGECPKPESYQAMVKTLKNDLF